MSRFFYKSSSILIHLAYVEWIKNPRHCALRTSGFSVWRHLSSSEESHHSPPTVDAQESVARTLKRCENIPNNLLWRRVVIPQYWASSVQRIEIESLIHTEFFGSCLIFRVSRFARLSPHNSRLLACVRPGQLKGLQMMADGKWVATWKKRCAPNPESSVIDYRTYGFNVDLLQMSLNDIPVLSINPGFHGFCHLQCPDSQWGSWICKGCVSHWSSLCRSSILLD